VPAFQRLVEKNVAEENVRVCAAYTLTLCAACACIRLCATARSRSWVTADVAVRSWKTASARLHCQHVGFGFSIRQRGVPAYQAACPVEA